MKDQKKVFQAFTFILQFTLNMLVPIGLCMALGVWLDERTICHGLLSYSFL